MEIVANDCVRSELKEVKDTSLIQWVGEGIKNVSVRNVYESYYDKSNVTLENEESSINADFYDTSTISGQKEKENKKEKQTTEGEVGQSFVTEEQLTFLTKFYDENLQRASGYIIFANVLNIWHVQMV
ncbi:hypothetical protein [Lysinibacillus fusiformis]